MPSRLGCTVKAKDNILRRLIVINKLHCRVFWTLIVMIEIFLILFLKILWFIVLSASFLHTALHRSTDKNTIVFLYSLIITNSGGSPLLIIIIIIIM